MSLSVVCEMPRTEAIASMQETIRRLDTQPTTVEAVEGAVGRRAGA